MAGRLYGYTHPGQEVEVSCTDGVAELSPRQSPSLICIIPELSVWPEAERERDI